jgi:hypothetical protein
MLNKPALKANATASPLNTSGVAFSRVLASAVIFPKEPFNKAAYAAMGEAPETARIAAPIKAAIRTAAIGTLTDRHKLIRMAPSEGETFSSTVLMKIAF